MAMGMNVDNKKGIHTDFTSIFLGECGNEIDDLTLVYLDMHLILCYIQDMPLSTSCTDYPVIHNMLD